MKVITRLELDTADREDFNYLLEELCGTAIGVEEGKLNITVQRAAKVEVMKLISAAASNAFDLGIATGKQEIQGDSNVT